MSGHTISTARSRDPAVAYTPAGLLPQASRRNRGISSGLARTIRGPWGFLLPLLLFVLTFILLPVAGTVLNAFFRDVPYLPRKFVGLRNFVALIGDPGLLQALRFTLLFTFVSVSLELVLGIAMAVLLDSSVPYRSVLRAVILVPWAIPAAISARTWELIYNYSYGAANALLSLVGVASPVNWLGTSASAFVALIVADVWKTTPFAAIILLAGLSAIPDDLYRQARIDGAHAGSRFLRITLPLLRPVITVTVLFRTIDAVRVFDLNYVLTHGGPGGSTTSLSLYGYSLFVSGDFGYGSAVSVLLFAVAFLLSVAYVKIGRFEEELR